MTLIIFLFSSCTTKTSNLKTTNNDTTTALSLLLNKDFLGRNMPGYGGLQRQGPFGDTIIFRKDGIVSEYLTKNFNGFHFKFLTQEQICEQAILYHSDTTDFPNLFQLQRIQKRDSTYDIALQETCVMPLYNKNGKKLLDIDAGKSNKCIFGMLCGGGIAVTV
ncbi:MAG: hypothetical protein ABI472_23235 [Ginsengibacter sp.]